LATSDRRVGWAVLSLCQIAAVRARMRCRTRTATPILVRPPWRSRSSWPLKVWLTDSTSCAAAGTAPPRLERALAEASALPWNAYLPSRRRCLGSSTAWRAIRTGQPTAVEDSLGQEFGPPR
jgi:hypothetical protein